MPFGISAGAAALIGAGVTGAATIGSGILSSNATSKAASDANATQRQALEVSRADLEPWRTAGQGALTGVQNAAGLNGQPGYDAAMTAFHTSPGYQFQLDQGLRAVDAGAASKGILNSGATLKAEQTFGTGLADKEFTDYYNRLFDLSKLGENAASGSAAASQATGTSMAQTDLSEGSAQASIYGNAAKGVGDAAGSYMNNSLYADRTNALMNYGNPGARAAGVQSSSATYNPNVNMTLPSYMV